MAAPTPAARALALARQGRLVDAKAVLEAVPAVAVSDPDAVRLLGAICLALGDAAAQRGDVAAALALYAQSVRAAPDNVQAHYNRGVVLYRSGRTADAAASYRAAIVLEPRLGDAHSALGVALSESGEHAAAIESHERAVALAPGNAEFHNNFGLALDHAQRATEAVERYDRALALVPHYVAAWSNRGVALHRLGRVAEALASADRALAIDGDDAEAWSNRGLALHDLGRDDEAVAACARSTALDPSLANAWANLGAALAASKRPVDALAAYDRALALDPRAWQAHGDRLHTAMVLCDWAGFDATVDRLVDAIARGDAYVHPFTLLPTPASAAVQKRCAERYAAAQVGRAAESTARTPLPAPPPSRDGRIRLAYFSADFHRHATMDLMAELFERHDRARFELTAFAFGPARADAMRDRAVAAFDRFVDVGDRSDDEVAALARGFGIDIAVDLKGFTRDARPGIFATRAAPVQVSYLGYPGTMGMACIEHLIADAVVVPASAEGDYSERIARLPHCYQANGSWQAVEAGPIGRRDAGLPDEGVVFCCFNNSWKITPDVFAAWMRLLAAVPGSVLWLLEANATAAANLRAEANRHAVDAARLVFAARTDRAAHLSRHRLADLFLDTLHYGAHTTASDALRAGLPIITRLGATFPSRVAASLLGAVGLGELATASVADYEALALALARDPQRLANVRARLAAALPQSPLFAADRFARDLERLYETMLGHGLPSSGRPVPEHP